jgi:hypothetical protein
MTRTSAPCPCCHGDGKRHDGYMGTIDDKAKCPACSGTGLGPRGRGGDTPESRKARVEHQPLIDKGGRCKWRPAEEAHLIAALAAISSERGATGRMPSGFCDRVANELHTIAPDLPRRTRRAVHQMALRLTWRGHAHE